MVIRSCCLKHAILETIRAGRKREQFVRYWLGAGRGGFGISPSECLEPSFYCMSLKYVTLPEKVYQEGIGIVTSTVPMKPKRFANVKTTNYLPNALMVAEAERSGNWGGIWVTDKGHLAEFATCNVGLVLEDRTLTVPPFDLTLAGISVQRAMELAQTKLGWKVDQRIVSVNEAKQSKEMFALGGAYTTIPIVRWDGALVGDGKVGQHAKMLRGAQLRDLEDGWGDKGQLELVEGLGQ